MNSTDFHTVLDWLQEQDLTITAEELIEKLISENTPN